MCMRPQEAYGATPSLLPGYSSADGSYLRLVHSFGLFQGLCCPEVLAFSGDKLCSPAPI